MYKLPDDIVTLYINDSKLLKARKDCVEALFRVETDNNMTKEIMKCFERMWKVCWSSKLMPEEKDIKKLVKKYEDKN